MEQKHNQMMISQAEGCHTFEKVALICTFLQVS